MLVSEVCNKAVVVAEKSMPLNAAARLMRDMHVGSLVVVDEGTAPKPLGMLTDRDLVIAVIAKGIDASTMRVGDISSAKLAFIREDQSVLDALRVMRARGVRRLPVIDGGGSLAGIITLDDLLEVVNEQLSDIVYAIGNGQSRELRGR